MIAKIEHGIVVVPWNFSKLSRFALEHALSLVDDPHCIRVVHVATPLSGPDNGVLYASAENRKCKEIEQRYRDLLEDEPHLAAISFHVVYGWPAREIARFARNHHAGMIVMSAKERHGISRYLFGGVAEGVISESDCSVLVLQGPHVETRLEKPHNFFAATWNRVIKRRTSAVISRLRP